MNIDPLAEKYVSTTPYAYVLNNPLMYIDPDGREIEISNIYKKNKDGSYVNPNMVKAYEVFASSDVGKVLLSKFAKKGQELIPGKSGKLKVDGAYHKKDVNLSFSYLEGSKKVFLGNTNVDVKDDKLSLTVELRPKDDTGDYIETIGHETITHVEKFATDFSDNKKLDFSIGIDKDIIKHTRSFGYDQRYDASINQHLQERRDRVMEKKMVPLLINYYKSIGVIKSKESLIDTIYGYAN